MAMSILICKITLSHLAFIITTSVLQSEENSSGAKKKENDIFTPKISFI